MSAPFAMGRLPGLVISGIAYGQQRAAPKLG